MACKYNQLQDCGNSCTQDFHNKGCSSCNTPIDCNATIQCDADDCQLVSNCTHTKYPFTNTPENICRDFKDVATTGKTYKVRCLHLRLKIWITSSSACYSENPFHNASCSCRLCASSRLRCSHRSNIYCSCESAVVPTTSSTTIRTTTPTDDKTTSNEITDTESTQTTISYESSHQSHNITSLEPYITTKSSKSQTTGKATDFRPTTAKIEGSSERFHLPTDFSSQTGQHASNSSSRSTIHHFTKEQTSTISSFIDMTEPSGGQTSVGNHSTSTSSSRTKLAKSESSSSLTPLIGGSAGGGVLLVFMIAVMIFILLRKRRRGKNSKERAKEHKMNGGTFPDGGFKHDNMAYDMDVISKSESYDYAVVEGASSAKLTRKSLHGNSNSRTVINATSTVECHDSEPLYENQENRRDYCNEGPTSAKAVNEKNKSSFAENSGRESEYDSLHSTKVDFKGCDDHGQYDHVKRYPRTNDVEEDSSQTYDHLQKSYERHHGSIPDDFYDHCKIGSRREEGSDYDHLHLN